MCRTILEGGRRCPKHELTPEKRNTINSRRRENYHNNKIETITRMVETLKTEHPFPTDLPVAYDKHGPEYKNFIGRYTRTRLTKHEKEILYGYTEMDFKKIRQTIYRKNERGKSMSFSKEAREDVKAKMEVLDKILARAPKARKPTVLYRGAAIPNYEDINTWLDTNYPVGGIFQDKSYLSTSACVSRASDFPNRTVEPGRHLMFEIISDNGLPIPGTAGFMGDEFEVLFPRKTKFAVVEVLKDHEYEWDDLPPKDGQEHGWLQKRKVTLIRLIDTSLYRGEK